MELQQIFKINIIVQYHYIEALEMLKLLLETLHVSSLNNVWIVIMSEGGGEAFGFSNKFLFLRNYELVFFLSYHVWQRKLLLLLLLLLFLSYRIAPEICANNANNSFIRLSIGVTY